MSANNHYLDNLEHTMRRSISLIHSTANQVITKYNTDADIDQL